MTKFEIAQLLTYVAAFQNQAIDELTVEAWASQPMVQELSLDDGRQIVNDFFASGEKWFTIQTIVNAVKERNRLQPWQVEADVRSAKARGLVDRDWPAGDVLPESVRFELERARRGDIAEVKALTS